MYECNKCGKWTAEYNYQIKAFVCNDCGHEESMKPKYKKCFNCGNMYTYWTDFDVSSCSCCGKSFVD